MKRVIVFDFDGVLADSFEPLYLLNRDSFRQIGMNLSREEYCGLFQGHIHRSLREKIANPDHLKSFKAFKDRAFERYYRRAKLFPFSKKLVSDLAKKYNLAIVSSTPGPLILRMLRNHGVGGFFAVVLDALGSSKEAELKNAVIQTGGRSCRGKFFVSDTVGDLLLGSKLGMETLAVCWGFHEEKDLRKTNPEKVFLTPRALRNYLLKAA